MPTWAIALLAIVGIAVLYGIVWLMNAISDMWRH